MNTYIKKIFFAVGLVLAGFVPAHSVSAVTSTSPIQNWEGVVHLLEKAGQWMYQAFFIIAVMYFLWGAFTFLQAGGDAAKVAEGKKRILYGVIAVIVALVSTGVAQIINSFLSAGAN